MVTVLHSESQVLHIFSLVSVVYRTWLWHASHSGKTCSTHASDRHHPPSPSLSW